MTDSLLGGGGCTELEVFKCTPRSVFQSAGVVGSTGQLLTLHALQVSLALGGKWGAPRARADLVPWLRRLSRAGGYPATSLAQLLDESVLAADPAAAFTAGSSGERELLSGASGGGGGGGEAADPASPAFAAKCSAHLREIYDECRG